jgi:nucleoside-diphosphate-sugar epimerase
MSANPRLTERHPLVGVKSEASSLKVLVTGGSGFIGTALVSRLAAEGVDVRATWRRGPEPTLARVEWRRLLEIDRAETWVNLVLDCQIVIHAAALAHQTGRAATGRWHDFSRINVEATRLVAKASAAAQVRRVILMSSVGAVCTKSNEPIDEQTPPAPSEDYGRSKFEAEQALQTELAGSATDWCILRPPLVYGPDSPTNTGNMRRLLRLISTGLPMPFGGITNCRSFIFIDNLVDAICTVIRHVGEIRSTYFVSDGTDFATPALAAALATAAGRTARSIAVPVRVLKVLGQLGDAGQRFLKIESGINSYSVDRLVGSLQVNSTKFRKCFAWHPPVDVQTALKVTCNPLRECVPVPQPRP